MKKTRYLIFTLIGVLLLASPAQAYWIWSPDLGKWINPKQSAKDTPEQQFDWAIQFYNQKEYDRAIEEFEKLIGVYPTSRLAAESVYYSGLCWEAKQDLAKAADSYQKLISSYPYSDRIKEAVKREFEIANLFAKGEKVKVLGMPALPGQEKAMELYNHIIKNAPFGSYGDQAQFKIAELYKAQGEFDEARKAFQAVIDEYPTSDLVPKAKYEIANVSMLASKATHEEDLHTDRALEEFQQYKQTFPAEAETAFAEASIKALRTAKAQSLWDIADFYEKQKKWNSAKLYYTEIGERFADTPLGPEAKKKTEELIKKQNEPPASGFKLF